MFPLWEADASGPSAPGTGGYWNLRAVDFVGGAGDGWIRQFIRKRRVRHDEGRGGLGGSIHPVVSVLLVLHELESSRFRRRARPRPHPLLGSDAVPSDPSVDTLPPYVRVLVLTLVLYGVRRYLLRSRYWMDALDLVDDTLALPLSILARLLGRAPRTAALRAATPRYFPWRASGGRGCRASWGARVHT